MDRKKYLAIGFVMLATVIMEPVVSQGNTVANPETTTIEKAVSEFLTAFDNLDWSAFRACFSRSATIFHPSAPNVRRIDSPDQFDKAWLGVFDRIKKSSGRTHPPYMNLRPTDLRVERLSVDVALVTFHLVEGTTVDRRTIVLKHDPEGWKIVHIHASNLTTP